MKKAKVAIATVLVALAAVVGTGVAATPASAATNCKATYRGACLYEHADKGGWFFWSENQYDFRGSTKWNDNTSSLEITGTKTHRFFEHSEWRGVTFTVAPGRYLSNLALVGYNDMISCYRNW